MTKKITSLSLGLLICLLVLALLAVSKSLNEFKEKNAITQREELMDEAKQYLLEKLQIGANVLEHFYQLSLKDSGHTTEYQEAAVAAINQISWQHGGYFFLSDFSGTVITVPPTPSLAGKNIMNHTDPNGVPYVRELVEGAQKGISSSRYAIIKPGTKEIIPKLSSGKKFAPWNWMIGTGVYIDDIDNKIIASQALLEAEIKGIQTKLLLLTLPILIIAAVILIGSTRYFLKPLTSVASSLNSIASGQGDLTVSLAITDQTETGKISLAFNAFVKKIHQIIAEVKSNTFSLVGQSMELGTTTEAMTNNSVNLRNRSQQVREASELTQSRLNSIATGSEEFSTTVNQVAATVEELTVSFNSVVENCQKGMSVSSDANERVGETSRALEDMVKASQEIGKVSDLIQAVAAQTNLLALNATIEAASAGDAGKGFSVVAAEVKELARQTAQAVGTIGSQIHEVQNKAKESSQYVQEIKEKISEVNQMTQSILGAVEQQSSAVSEFRRSLEEAGITAKEIAQEVSDASSNHETIHQNLSEIDQLTEESAVGAEQIRQSMSHLVQMASKLEGLVENFRT